jgi:hypothetical protein
MRSSLAGCAVPIPHSTTNKLIKNKYKYMLDFNCVSVMMTLNQLKKGTLQWHMVNQVRQSIQAQNMVRELSMAGNKKPKNAVTKTVGKWIDSSLRETSAN